MVETYFPDLQSEVRGHLETVRLHLIENPEYLDNPLCPYAPELRSFLKDLLGRGGPAAPSVKGSDAAQDFVDIDDLEGEVSSLIQQIKEFGNSLGSDDKASDRASYFRVSAALLEKLITLKERASGMQQFSRLKQFLLRFAEDHLSPDQRTLFMDSLKTFGESA